MRSSLYTNSVKTWHGEPAIAKVKSNRKYTNGHSLMHLVDDDENTFWLPQNEKANELKINIDFMVMTSCDIL